jgi:hypothetical protein
MVMICGSSWIFFPFAKILKGFNKGSHQSNDKKKLELNKDRGVQDFDNERVTPPLDIHVALCTQQALHGEVIRREHFNLGLHALPSPPPSTSITRGPNPSA